jgi:hypothetical protein
MSEIPRKRTVNPRCPMLRDGSISPRDPIRKLDRLRDVMRLFLAIFLGLCLSASSALAAEEYGDWSLETLKGGAVITLVQRIFLPDHDRRRNARLSGR